MRSSAVRWLVLLPILAFWAWVLIHDGVRPFISVLLPVAIWMALTLPLLLRFTLLNQYKSRLTVESMDEDDWPKGTRNEVQEFASKLEQLGFELVRDEAWRLGSKVAGTNYIRVMENRELHCLGLVYAPVLRGSRLLPAGFMIISCLGNSDNMRPLPQLSPIADPNSYKALEAEAAAGMVLSSQNTKLTRVQKLSAHPKFPTIVLRNAGLPELLNVHITERERIMQRTGLNLAQENLADQYVAFQRRFLLELHNFIARKNPWTWVLSTLLKGPRNTAGVSVTG